jgi:hypothetical protein
MDIEQMNIEQINDEVKARWSKTKISPPFHRRQNISIYKKLVV